MPSSIAAQYRLVKLRKEELLVQCKQDDYEMWGGPQLTAEQYQEKEARQRSTSFSKQGSIFWALVSKRDASDTLDTDDDLHAGTDPICCHCESHRFECLVRTANGDVVRGYSYHIGSVFTLPAYRKQGLATFFLQLIASELQSLPDTYASVLYSDIGPRFYDQLGWKCYPSKEASMALDSSKNTQTMESTSPQIGEALYLDDRLKQVLDVDNKRTEESLKLKQEKEVLAVLPTKEAMEWTFCVGQVYAHVREYKEIPTQCGLYIDPEAFVLWLHNFKESALYLLHARLPESRPDAILHLIAASFVEAKKYGLATVKLWAPPSVLHSEAVSNALDISFYDRDDSLSSAMVFPPDHAAASLPEWIDNEKFCWV